MLGLTKLRLQYLFPLPNQRPPQRHFQFPPPLNPSPPTRMHPKAAPSKLRLERLNLFSRAQPAPPASHTHSEPYPLPHKTLPTLRTPVVQPKDLRLPPTPRAKKQRQPPPCDHSRCQTLTSRLSASAPAPKLTIALAAPGTITPSPSAWPNSRSANRPEIRACPKTTTSQCSRNPRGRCGLLDFTAMPMGPPALVPEEVVEGGKTILQGKRR